MNKKEQEALRRLNLLVEKKGLLRTVANEYESERVLYLSERTPFGGILYWADEDNVPKEVWNEINRIKASGDVVYHITHEVTSFGELYDLWVITEEDVDEDSAEYMREDFDSYGIQFSYVVNISVPEFSEYGSIAISCANGGCIRND